MTRRADASSFVIQYWTSRLHYDVHLELAGIVFGGAGPRRQQRSDRFPSNSNVEFSVSAT